MSEPKFKLNIKALAAMMNCTIEELATKAEINPTHLKSVNAGRATMSAYDLLQLHLLTGVPCTQIEINY